MKALKSIYGNELDNPQYREGDQKWDLEKRTANQFAFVHQKAIEEQKATTK
jgi:hypothetical protein